MYRRNRIMSEYDNTSSDDYVSGFGLGFEHEASMIAEIALSVVRDRAISSLYGYRSSEAGMFLGAATVFKEEYSYRLTHKLEECAKGASGIPLYSGAGELLGQLCRLLMVCKERGVLQKYVQEADEAIGQLNLDIAYMDDGDYIRHLRNAIMHCRYEVQIDPEDFSKSRAIFLDLKNGGKQISGQIALHPDQINAVMDILIKDVCLRYLDSVGWTFLIDN